MELHWVGFQDLAESQRALVENRVERLATGHRDLIDVRLTGRRTRHHRHGEQEVRITCQARGQEVIAVRTCPDLEQALNEALDTFEREVHRLRDKQRDLSRARSPLPPHLGVIDRIFRQDGYGFILTDDGDQVYFHRNAVKEGLEFERLEESDRVVLNIEAGREGPQATMVAAPPLGEA